MEQSHRIYDVLGAAAANPNAGECVISLTWCSKVETLNHYRYPQLEEWDESPVGLEIQTQGVTIREARHAVGQGPLSTTGASRFGKLQASSRQRPANHPWYLRPRSAQVGWREKRISVCICGILSIGMGALGRFQFRYQVKLYSFRMVCAEKLVT